MGSKVDELYLPVNRPVVFRVTSEDVIHSFWVVQMGIKVDATPGETTTTEVTPDKLGIFDVRCAELCGLLHADMETDGSRREGSEFRFLGVRKWRAYVMRPTGRRRSR